MDDSWQGVTLGMWVDDLLKIHPKADWVTKKPTVKVDKRTIGMSVPDLIVTYHYKEADILLERATIEDPLHGPITVYAVQKITLKDDTNGHNGKHRKHKNKGHGTKRRKKRR